VGKFSLPSFHNNFENGEITNQELKDELLVEVKQFQNSLL
jgi:hypothetical protein